MQAAMSYTKRTRQAKINAAIGAEALKMAKENNDILYKRANLFKTRWRKMLGAIQMKYGTRAKAKVMSQNAKKES
jgi:hypothetical protein